MPVIFRFYLKHCLIGFAISAAFVTTLLWLNVANLWQLISGSDIGLMAVIVFWILNGIVFAGVQTGVAIMLMAEPEKRDPPGGTRLPLAATPQPVRVPVDS